MLPKVSIIVPTLDQRTFIEEALKSVWSQNYSDIELIVVDGGSTDGTGAFLEANRSRIDIYICEPDSGTSEAINKGFKTSSGELLWVLNSDDRFASSNSISNLVNYLQDSDAGFVYGDLRIIDTNGNTIGVRRFGRLDPFNLLTDRRQLPWTGCLLRRQTLSRVGYFDEELKFSNDLDFFLRLACQTKIIHLQSITGELRIHKQSSTLSNIHVSAYESIKVSKKFLDMQSNLFSREQLNEINAIIIYFQVSTQFHTGDAIGARNSIKCLMQADQKYYGVPKVWIYYLCSLFGNRILFILASTFRKLIRTRLFYLVNNSNFFMFTRR